MQGEYITGAAWTKMFNFFQMTYEIYIESEANLKKFIEAIY